MSRGFDQCHALVQIPTVLPQSLNVAVAGSLVMYDRHTRGTAPRRRSTATLATTGGAP